MHSRSRREHDHQYDFVNQNIGPLLAPPLAAKPAPIEAAVLYRIAHSDGRREIRRPVAFRADRGRGGSSSASCTEVSEATDLDQPAGPRFHTDHASCALRERCRCRFDHRRGPRQGRSEIDEIIACRDFGERVVRHADRLGHGRIGLTLEEAADDAAGGTESARTRTPAVCRPAVSLMRRG